MSHIHSSRRKSSAIREKRDFYGKPDNTILLSNYIELTSLKEVVKEIIPVSPL